MLWQQSFHNMSAILAAFLNFSKILFYANLEQTLLKLVENMCLQPQIGISKLEQIFSKNYSFLF